MTKDEAAESPDPEIEGLVEHHKAECMRYRGRGECSIHRCLTRGGYVRGETSLPLDLSIATCEAHETVSALTAMAGEIEQWKCNSRENKLIAESAEARVTALTAEVERLKSGLEGAIGARSRWMSEAEKLKAEVERLTGERDALIAEKTQSSWGEFQRQGRMLKEVESLRDSWKERAEALEAQVERLTKSNDEVVTEGLRLFRERDKEIERLKGAMKHAVDLLAAMQDQRARLHLERALTEDTTKA